MKRMMVLSSCNIWKEEASSSIIGVFDDEDKLKEVVYKMFLNSEINWRGKTLEELDEEAKQEWESYYENPEEYDDDFDIDEAISDTAKKYKEQIFDDIQSSTIEEIHDSADYLMIQMFKPNEV